MIKYFFGAIFGFLIGTTYFCNELVKTHDNYHYQIPKIAKAWHLIGCKMGRRMENTKTRLTESENTYCSNITESSLKDYETIWRMDFPSDF